MVIFGPTSEGGEGRERKDEGREEIRGKKKKVGPTCHVDTTSPLNDHFYIV